MNLNPIGELRTPYPEKFGIPRQAGLVEQALAKVHLHPEFNQVGVFDGLESCTHLWVLFWFHQQEQKWSPKIRPPRLGGNKKLGVFASRSPRRPNPIGLSVLEIVEIDASHNSLVLSGPDILDRTPILDLKPYLPYSDCLPQAEFSLAAHAPERLLVEFHPKLDLSLQDQALISLIEQSLSLDPRPAYHQDNREYGSRFESVNVRWRFSEGKILVTEIQT